MIGIIHASLPVYALGQVVNVFSSNLQTLLHLSF